MFEEIDEICDGIGCSRNDWIKDTLQEKLRDEANDDPKIQKIIKKNRVFDCREGKLYEDDILLGDCSDYGIDKGNVYNKDGSFMGKTVFVERV